jgi:hypothetical protein
VNERDDELERYSTRATRRTRDRGWTRCSDHMPAVPVGGHSHDLLVVVEDHTDGRLQEMAYWDGEHWRDATTGDYVERMGAKVTHWRRRPEFPKKAADRAAEEES